MQLNYLPTLNSPEDIRGFSNEQLYELCDELRAYIIDTITQIGGHLGIKELTRKVISTSTTNGIFWRNQVLFASLCCHGFDLPVLVFQKKTHSCRFGPCAHQGRV